MDNPDPTWQDILAALERMLAPLVREEDRSRVRGKFLNTPPEGWFKESTLSDASMLIYSLVDDYGQCVTECDARWADGRSDGGLYVNIDFQVSVALRPRPPDSAAPQRLTISISAE